MASPRTKRLSAKQDKADRAGKGHNSAHDPEKVAKAIIAAAKKQKKLDEERETAITEFRGRHKAITGDLKSVGISRAAFDHEYNEWLKRENADTAEEKRRAAAQEVVFRDECRAVYEALNEGDQLDMLTVKTEAEKARVTLAKMAEKVTEGAEEEL